ncbi:MAG: serpin family protein [Ruminococcaceae bacterium]|nr:serpin family protein [Oscillospiraceae bacterium]
MNEKLVEALGYVNEKYISHAAKRKHIKRRNIVSLIAAMLAIVILLEVPDMRMTINAKAVSLPTENRGGMTETAFDEWEEKQTEMLNAAETLGEFTANGSVPVLSGTQDDNRIWSPVNAYIALSMTAEMTGEEQQEDILAVLGRENMDSLREISTVWENIYRDDGKETSVLANSLWLDKNVSYRQDIMDTISYHYYAPVYAGDLGSRKTDRDITNWLDNQTGGFMKHRTGRVDLKDDCMLALASTIYFQGQWVDKFDSKLNTNAVFHSPSEDITCTFMNAKEMNMTYYWGEDFGAVSQWLKNNAKFWFILPDEDKTVEDVLNSGEYAKTITASQDTMMNQKQMLVNLSVPKFDVSSSVDLREAFTDLGLGDLFDPQADALGNAVRSESPVWIDSIQQESRVTIDEEGVTAASYLLIPGAGAAAPPDEIIDFVVDRPFIFAITMYDIPMFVGVVNTP